MQLKQRESVGEVCSLVLLVHEASVVAARELRQPQGESVLEVAVQDLVQVSDLFSLFVVRCKSCTVKSGVRSSQGGRLATVSYGCWRTLDGAT